MVADAPVSPGLGRSSRSLTYGPWLVIALGVGATLFLPGASDGTPIRSATFVTLTIFFVALVARLVVCCTQGAAEAMRLLRTDELTGLPNRRALMAAADDALERCEPVG